MTDTHNKKKTNTDFFINFIKKELLESDFKDQLQLQLLYIIIPIIIIIAKLNFFTTLGAMFLFKINC